MDNYSVLSTPLGIGLFAVVISILPVLFLMVTPFLKLSIVLGVLRIGFGSQGVPGAGIVGALALVLSLFAARPLLSAIVEEARVLLPLTAGARGSPRNAQPEVTFEQLRRAAKRLEAPVEEFLTKHAGVEERRFFTSKSPPETPEIFTLIPAFVLSELRAGFKMALYLFLPFLVVDLLVTTILTGMGMMMVNPVTITFPLKLLLFVSCDGWLQLTSGLLQAYRN